MKPSFLLRLAILNISGKKLRAFLTIGGIGLSTGIMIVLFGLGSGLQNVVTKQIAKTELQSVVTVSSKNIKQLKLDQTAISKIQSISGVTNVEQSIAASGQVSYHDIALTLPIYGVTAGYFTTTPVITVAGNTSNQFSGDQDNIILSPSALKAFGLSPNEAINKKVKINLSITKEQDVDQAENTRQVASKIYTITGVIERGNSPVAYISAEHLFKHGVDVATQAKAQLAYPEKLAPVRESIERMGYQTTSVKDAIDQVNKVFNVIKTILIVFGIITLTVAIFGTFNTITIELVEQTRQIGFLRVIGIKRDDVGLLFIMQSMMLSVFGAIVGVVGGVITGLMINGVIAAFADEVSDPSELYIYQLPIVAIIIMLMLSVLLGWLVGLVPAKRAVKINPLEALKS